MENKTLTQELISACKLASYAFEKQDETYRTLAQNALMRVLQEATGNAHGGKPLYEELVSALCFASSVIKCGEPWSARCEEIITKAIVNYNLQSEYFKQKG